MTRWSTLSGTDAHTSIACLAIAGQAIACVGVASLIEEGSSPWEMNPAGETNILVEETGASSWDESTEGTDTWKEESGTGTEEEPCG